MALSTLSEIRKKVRRLTRSPSDNILSNADLDQYINTFILYNFPQSIRAYNLRSTFTFYTQPNVDVYETEPTDVTNALYNFKNKVVAIHPTVYISGVPAFYTQSVDEFYGNYSKYKQITNQVGITDGTVGPFTGTIPGGPLLQRNVMLSTIDVNDVARTVVDWPFVGTGAGAGNNVGLLSYPNTPVTSAFDANALGFVNYLTGQYEVEFPTGTVDGNVITAATVPYQAGQPTSMLFYDQKFTLRPVPDKAYSVEMQVDIRPTELLSQNQEPNLAQWWQYIAYGAAKLVFEDRMDLDSVGQIYPEFKRQQEMVLSSTATTLANERTSTIYTQGSRWNYGWWGPWNGQF